MATERRLQDKRLKRAANSIVPEPNLPEVLTAARATKAVTPSSPESPSQRRRRRGCRAPATRRPSPFDAMKAWSGVSGVKAASRRGTATDDELPPAAIRRIPGPSWTAAGFAARAKLFGSHGSDEPMTARSVTPWDVDGDVRLAVGGQAAYIFT
jgi:hypothetical protein